MRRSPYHEQYIRRRSPHFICIFYFRQSCSKSDDSNSNHIVLHTDDKCSTKHCKNLVAQNFQNQDNVDFFAK